MQIPSPLIVALALVSLASNQAGAEPVEVRANTVTVDPISGAIGFTGENLGRWAAAYERRLGPHHAVRIEQTWVHVHAPPWHLTVAGLGLGYRYYVHASDSGPFVGAIAGGKLGFGRYGHDDGGGDGMDHDLMARAVHVTANAGWRMTWASGFTLVARIGAGWAHYALGDDAPAEAEAEMDDRLTPLRVELDTELSLGYAF